MRGGWVWGAIDCREEGGHGNGDEGREGEEGTSGSGRGDKENIINVFKNTLII
jgi:hypothetical protein